MEGHLSTVCVLILILGAIVHSDAQGYRRVKPGVCPRYGSLYAPLCHAYIRPPCIHDYHCPGNLKCCRNNCGPVCAAPIKVKPGVCPRFYWTQSFRCSVNGLLRCTQDGNCPGSLKCCNNGCGRVCVLPRQPSRPGVCPRFFWSQAVRCSVIGQIPCHQDQNCPASLKCCSNGCGRVCVRPQQPPRPGVCPNFSWSQSFRCTVRGQLTCHQDENCPASLKCCYNGCGRVCVRPLETRPGVCPSFFWTQSVRCSVRGLPRCHQDGNCPASLKCCDNGCGRVCVRPLQPPRPGVCPRFNWSPTVRCTVRGHRTCHQDQNCPASLKCCYNGCGRVCVRPRQYPKPPVYVQAAVRPEIIELETTTTPTPTTTPTTTTTPTETTAEE